MFLLLLGLGLVVGIILLVLKEHYDFSYAIEECLEVVGNILTVVSSIILFFTILVGILNYNGTKMLVVECETTGQTIQNLRENNEFENVSMANKIIDINSRVMVEKEWNKSFWFGYQVYDGIDNVELLK